MSGLFKKIITRILATGLYRRIDNFLTATLPLFGFGHYHSTVPSASDLRKHKKKLGYTDIDFNEERQMLLLEQLRFHYNEYVFAKDITKEKYYYFNMDYRTFSVL